MWVYGLKLTRVGISVVRLTLLVILLKSVKNLFADICLFVLCSSHNVALFLLSTKFRKPPPQAQKGVVVEYSFHAPNVERRAVGSVIQCGDLDF